MKKSYCKNKKNNEMKRIAKSKKTNQRYVYKLHSFRPSEI